jgi:hypothetical protein
VGVRKPSGSADSSTVSNKMKEVLQTLFGGTRAEQMQFKVQLQSTGNDPQYDRHVNEDVIVSLIYRINLLFPLTSYIFADKPKKLGIKRITVTVRMPVEKPLLN